MTSASILNIVLDLIVMILSYFSGVYNVPLGNLKCPSKDYFVRSIDEGYVKEIEKNILEYPHLFIDPLICLVEGLNSSTLFNPNNIKDYQFLTLGGNHRRTALQNLVATGKCPYETVPAQLCFGE